LVSSSFYFLLLAYSQQLSFDRIFYQYGPPEARLNGSEGIAVDPSSGNIYVADIANNRISAFTSRSPISNVAFSSEEGEMW
jgi:DNA-binding beta-propeller fold protein YncE